MAEHGRSKAAFLLTLVSGLLAAASFASGLPSTGSGNYSSNNTILSGGGTNTSSSGFFSSSAVSQLAIGNASSSSYNTSLGFFNLLNSAPSLTSVSSNVSVVKYGDSIRVTTSGAADEDEDSLRLKCGESQGSSNLCVGEYGSPERTCDFSSPWSDNSLHTVYCRVFDSSDFSEPDRTVQINSQNPPQLIFVSPTLDNQSTTGNDWIYVNVSSDKILDTCLLDRYNGSWQNVSMDVSGSYCYVNMTGLSQANYYFRVYGNDSYGNMNVTEDRQIAYSIMQVQITRLISPSLLVARESETLNSTTTVKYSSGVNPVYMINITSEVPYDFTPPSAGDVRVYFVDYAPYGRREITGNASVSVSVLDQSGTLPTLVMVNISSLWLTAAGGNMSVNDSIEVFYLMTSSQMEPNEYRSVYTNSTLKDILSGTGSDSILNQINSSEVVLRGYKRIWIPDLSNPQLLSGEIVIRAIGGPVSGILLSDYLPQGATLSGRNVTYYNQTSGTTVELFINEDYYVASPSQDTLPDGSYVDVYYYNFSYAFTNWDGNLYDNDSITIRYNVSVVGGGQWVLPAIISGYDPTYKKHIRTETFANANVPLFDVIVETITKIVNPGEFVRAVLKMINVGGPNAQVDVFNTYSVKTMEGGLIVEKSETFAVLEQKEKELSLQTPSTIAPGMYTFEAMVTYAGREAASTDTFEVTGMAPSQGAGDNTIFYLAAGIALVILVALIMLKRSRPPTPPVASNTYS